MGESKERKFPGFSFSIGCVSQSSVSVADDQHNKSQSEPIPSPKGEGRDEMGSFGKNVKGSSSPLGLGFIPLQKLIKSCKGFSQRFSFREEEEEDDDDDDDEGVEMEIGFPTDVQHVGHIGWDGTSSSLTTLKSSDGASSSSSSSSSSQMFSVSSVYLRQFELAMAAHADSSQSYKFQ